MGHAKGTGLTEDRHPNIGTAFCTRLSTTTPIGVLERTVGCFADRGVTVERVLRQRQLLPLGCVA